MTRQTYIRGVCRLAKNHYESYSSQMEAMTPMKERISFSVEATDLFPWSASRYREMMVSGGSANRPAPIDCKMKMWSSWSACDSCTTRKHRFRYLETPSQFGGTPCLEKQWDIDVCPKATNPCMVTDFCEETSFTCKTSGRCVDRELVCNGDRDCGDWTDEDGCETKKREDKCSSLSPIPGAGLATQGFNVLTGEFADHVLDHDYYGGLCEYVYNGEWKKLTYDAFCESMRYLDDEKNYRKPYNYLTYRFMAQATSEDSTEYYEDLNKFLRARQVETSRNFGVTVGAVSTFGMSASNEAKFITNVTQYANQDLGFVRLVSRVQTAQFKMRSSGLVLSERMYEDLMDLPEQYDFGRYATFLNSYGTHYLTQGTLGGTLEYVAVVNKTAMSASDHSASEIGSCIGHSIGISIPLSSTVSVGFKDKKEDCRKTKDDDTGKTSSHSSVKDVLSQVKGGTTGSSGGVMVVQDPDSYRKWGAMLKYNPTIIDSETLPIFELVRQSTAAGHAGPRLAHLRRSWDEYRLEFSSCRCAPCRHDGVPALGQSDCRCVCKEGFRGDACQETLRKGSTTDGAWSCWGAWTSCQSGRRSRTRSCSNPPPDGGAACLGSSSQTQQHC